MSMGRPVHSFVETQCLTVYGAYILGHHHHAVQHVQSLLRRDHSYNHCAMLASFLRQCSRPCIKQVTIQIGQNTAGHVLM